MDVMLSSIFPSFHNMKNTLPKRSVRADLFQTTNADDY